MLISTDSDDSLEELAGLAETAGAMVITRVLQKRPRPDPATYIGSGKAEELSLDCQALEIDLAIVDDELTGAQQRNLENALGVRVIDRTTLILDIFAQRAQSAEGKLQVELAQMKYRLPRLTGQGTAMSRLGGGIGTRGPGETRLEVDRRRIRKRIDDLERELKQIKQHRDLRRARREKQGQTTVALVGYTNAGKSTLLNALSGSDVFVEDKLFATLDTVMRKVDLPAKPQLPDGRHGRLHPQAAAPAGAGVPVDARGGGVRRPAGDRVRRLQPELRPAARDGVGGARRAGRRRPAADRGAEQGGRRAGRAPRSTHPTPS